MFYLLDSIIKTLIYIISYRLYNNKEYIIVSSFETGL